MMDGVAFSSKKHRSMHLIENRRTPCGRRSPTRSIQPEEAWKIMTGAAVPGDYW
jgi:molybdopterin biosynthesis enzyme